MLVHKSVSALTFFLKFYTMKGARGYLKIVLTFFRQKILLWSKCTLVPKMMHGHNSEFDLRFLFKFRTIKDTKRCTKIYCFFQKKCSGHFGHFGSKNDVPLQLEICYNSGLCTMKEGKRSIKLY